jgi:predicted peptidase
VYVTGLSMGGGSTWDYSAVYGQVAAAIVPVCGGTKPTSGLASAIASKNLPVWTLHSTGDAAVPVKWAQDWISMIDKNNPSIAANTKLTVWNSIGHNSTWSKAFNPSTKIDGMNIYEWMLQYRRG